MMLGTTVYEFGFGELLKLSCIELRYGLYKWLTPFGESLNLLIVCVIRRLSDDQKKKSYYRIRVWRIAPIIMYGVALWTVQLVNNTLKLWLPPLWPRM